MAECCFACGRALGRNPFRADTRDAQTVFVGRECYALVIAAGEAGYQPPLGGPRLYQLAPCEACGGTDDNPTDCAMDCPEPRPWTDAAKSPPTQRE